MKRNKNSICSIEEYWKPAVHRGYCWGHYERWRAYGDPTKGRTQQGKLLRWIDEVALHYSGNDCLAWPYARGDDGYGRVYVNEKTVPASRYICECVNGPPPTPEHQAAHSCGKGHEGCVNPNHLSWKTPAENAADRLMHGTHNRGEKCSTSILTESLVKKIREFPKNTSSARISKKLDISVHAVRQVRSGKTWNWLK